MYYLAVDIGASSGRHILCSIENNQLKLEEVYRFKNNVEKKNGHFYWNLEYLFLSIVEGMKECKRIGKIPTSMGIDTWAVDYVLVNKSKEAFAYRDSRNLEGVQKVRALISEKELYAKTGIQYQPFNTLYQLKSEVDLKDDDDFLMVPDYFNYLLTGNKCNEYTNMSTTNLLNIEADKIDEDLLKKVGLPHIFNKMVEPGTKVGRLTEGMKQEVGYDLDVIAVATHDTGSAYMASIAPKGIILSSGTWSLLGIESDKAIVTEEARKANFTNEGGYNHKYRFLKNIMGMWIIQEVSRNLDGLYSFQELQDLARTSKFEGTFDVNKDRFLKPEHMMSEIKKDFEERGLTPPIEVADVAYCVYNSLALSYKESVKELEEITDRTYDTINIIGGGCQNLLLNEMIARYTGKDVLAGPIEATALGNILAQLIANKEVESLEAGRELLKESFEIKVFKGE